MFSRYRTFDFLQKGIYDYIMIKIDSTIIEKAVYNLCLQANTCYDECLYNILLKKLNAAVSSDDKFKYSNILKNIKLAFDSKRPLCQDCGQVVVFVKYGCECICDKPVNEIINAAVEKAYTENCFRMSVVKNAIFERINTNTNTPALIYTDIVAGSEISIDLMIKGAGSENCSALKMFKPSAQKEDIYEFIKETIIAAGEKSCPPMTIGIGIGGTMEYAALLSKKSFFHRQNTEEFNFVKGLRDYLKTDESNILDIYLMTTSTHIACLPVAITINCHSTRHASAAILQNEVKYSSAFYGYNDIAVSDGNFKEVFCSDAQMIRSLKNGENILLTGEIYTARDAAHKKFKDYFEKNGKLPLDFNNKIIFYAGPCPATEDEIIGPVGPTTSFRMDEYCELMYSQGLLATIGKGERSLHSQNIINKYKGKYFTAQGGIACLLSKCVKTSEVIAFGELGTEAVRKLYVQKLPLKVVI